MCGIVGVAGNISMKMEEVFKRLLMIDTERGPHSTGIAYVNFNGECGYVKDVGTPWKLFATEEYKTIANRRHTVLIGHNRWATKGAVTADNAHPFLHGKILGVHNGTLRQQHLLDAHTTFEVDSDNIFYQMNKTGVDDTVSKLNGAFALVWYNSEDETLNMIRNHERPLYVCEVVDTGTIMWASESIMLDYASIKAGIKITTPEQIPCLKLQQWKITGEKLTKTDQAGKHIQDYVYPVRVYKSNNLTVVTPSKTSKVTEITAINKPKKTEVVFEVAGELDRSGEYYYTYATVVEGKYKGEVVRVYAGGKSKEYKRIRSLLMEGLCYFKGEICYSFKDGATKQIVNNVLPMSVVAMPDDYEFEEEPEPIIVNGIVYTPAEALPLVSAGCAWCAYKPKVHEINDCVFTDDGSREFLCPDCAQDESIACYLKEATNG